MADFSDVRTDAELLKLEQRIREEYARAWAELQHTAEEYFERFAVRDAEMVADLASGKITQAYYNQWRLNQMGIGRRWETLRDHMADRIVHADQVANAYINDATPTIFSLNHNYASYGIDMELRGLLGQSYVDYGISFLLYDEQTVKRLIMGRGKVPILPKRKVNIPKAMVWNKRRLTSELTTGILAGESTRKIANRFMNAVGMEERAAIRNARTAITGAQNAGRYESYRQASEMGVEIIKVWIATLDSTTRDHHRILDGEQRPFDELFTFDLRFPADQFGPPSEVYNCRCTMGRIIAGINDNLGNSRRFARDCAGNSAVANGVTYTGRDGTMSYDEWLRSQGW